MCRLTIPDEEYSLDNAELRVYPPMSDQWRSLSLSNMALMYSADEGPLVQLRLPVFGCA